MAIYAPKTLCLPLALCAAQALACNGTVTPETASRVDAPDLRGIAVYLPQVLENSESGPFADLLKTIARHYPEGRISFEIKPVKRVYLDTDDRGADFRFPIMKVRDNADGATPYQFSHEMMGKVTFVLYSNQAKPLRKIDILRTANLARYAVEAPPVNWGFPSKSVVNLELSLKQLNLGRIDAVLWAQEEADYLVRKHKLSHIHREHFDDFPDVLFMSCNRRGDFVNQALSRAIRAARASGELPEGAPLPSFAGFETLPERKLPVPTLLVASRDDPFCEFDEARRMAALWGAEFVDGGMAGHMGSHAGLGSWPAGQSLLQRLILG
ncbi:alpha/beta hydrolase [Pseudogulbenkiania ferrooxidans]|uniref:Uncharacterized protein n=1 Tax=Pseudogulbenkiania ferrooxidans EGD-HP2 TaxID=1388764 RepID=A0ABN0N6C9_9NEIS|nr:alpha/beta hydrolase [Pseudogulbenkiania ferrooxidans]ERE06361.1 hypothetical protein O166_09030 [Pseudogulbenkiania ferrooxidans EGD-HP2]